MRLTDALRLTPGTAVAFTGAGGKSWALETLAGESRGRLPFLGTTTTHLGLHQSGLAAEHLSSASRGALTRLQITSDLNLLVTGAVDEAGAKWTAPSADVLEALHRICRESGAILAIEADGARSRLIKAPAEHEPVVPPWVDVVVPVIALGAIGRPLGPTIAHRPERIAALLGIDQGEHLSTDHAARLMTSRNGGLKGVPDGAEIRFLMTGPDAGDGEGLARLVLDGSRARAAIVGGAAPEGPITRVFGRVAGVVLAAGGSVRLGRSKPIVEWKGEPLIRHVVRAAREAGLDPIVVVLGADAAAVRRSLQGEQVMLLENPAWTEGQSTSVRGGLQEVEPRVEAAIFLLADMPRVSADTIRRLVRRHQETLAYAVAPVAGGRRGNPVLFDRASFREFSGLTGDQGGRSLLDGRSWEKIEVDAAEFFDLDEPEDLARLEGST